MVDSLEPEQILASLRKDDLPVPRDEKSRAVNALRGMNPASVLTALSRGLEDADQAYRCEVAWVFLAYDFNTAIEHVRPLLLEDADEGVRGYIAELLGSSKRVEAVPLLIASLQQDADGANRWIAAWGLGNIGDPSALPALRATMQNDDGVDYEGRPVKKIAAEAIRRITQEQTTASVA